jgi:hypothetical protein
MEPAFFLIWGKGLQSFRKGDVLSGQGVLTFMIFGRLGYDSFVSLRFQILRKNSVCEESFVLFVIHRPGKFILATELSGGFHKLKATPVL